jgi:CxxC-x17-CxxC domain-containing protein
MITTDRTLTCRDCNKQFAFTASEQDFYAQKGFTQDPGRCPECREARKAQRGSTGSGNYTTNDRPKREMFTATCSDCGGVAELPFNPSGDRPVYCRDCFAKKRA